MTRSIFSLRSAGLILGVVVVLALAVGVVAMPTDAHACTEGCVDKEFDPKRGFKCGNGGWAWCQECTFCY